MKETSNWKEVHTAFINAQFEKAYEFINKTLKEEMEKIAKIYNVKNRKGYPSLFK